MARNKPIKVQNRVKKSSANSQWFQNVARSMGFTAADLVKDLMPNTSDFLSYNSADTMNMLNDMRTRSSSRQMLTRQFKNLPQIKAAEKAMNNIKADLMSGNFNNKAREKEFNFEDDDMDFGFGDFDDGGVEFIEDEPEVQNQTTIINTLPLAKVINANTEATVDTMVSIAEQQMAVESEKLLFNHKSTNSILGGLGAINDNLATLVKFNAESTAKYHAASIKFYEESLELMKKTNLSTNSAVDENNSINGLYTHTGGVHLKEYAKLIKDNLNDIREENVMITGVLDTLKDPSFINKFVKNPVGAFTSIGIKTAVPTAIKASLKAVDESISSIIPALLSKVNSLDGSDNDFLNKIYKVLGTKNKLSYEVDLGKYEKGPMSWDGESKKALTEVIPGYLRRIESALTGQEERMYNYSTGKFTSASNMKKEYTNKLREKETEGYLETKTKMRNMALGMNANADTMKQFEKDMEEYLAAMTKKGSLINPFVSVDKNGNKMDEFAALGLFNGDARRTQMIRNALKGLSMNELTKMATSQIHQSRQETQKFMEDVRKNPTMAGYSALNNGSYYDENGKLSYDPTKRLGARDKFGLSSLDYLRDIRQALLQGIKVFPDYMKDGEEPNKNLIRKHHNENKKYRKSEERKKREAQNNKPKYNYNDVLNMSEEELNELYNKHSETNGNKLGGISNLINKQVYQILFGVTDHNRGDNIQSNTSSILSGVASAGRAGGSIFSNTINFFNDSLKGVGAYFTGQSYTMSDGTVVPANPDSIMGKMKSFFTGSMDKLSEGKNGGLIGKVSKDFMDGFNQFKVSLFGEKRLGEIDKNQTMKDLMNKIKPRLPKALGMGLGGAVVKTSIASKLGLLGSIILPGGPLGAALVGTTFGFLKQSETFNKWLFGDKDKEGHRMGGFIPKSLVSMIENHGGAIKKGAVVGGAAGLLPSFFLPGGPIAGAIVGMSAGLLSKSDAFQEFLYGKDFRNKDSRSMMNGAFGKLYKNTIGKAAGEGTNPKLAAFLGTSGIGVGIAQGVGLLPSFLLPGGPVLGAMLGLAGGITASSDKFQQFLFGDKDVDGKRYGGLMTKFSNWFDTTVMSPLKIKMTEMNDNIYKFMKSKVFNPFLNAFEPLKQAGLFLIDDAKKAFSDLVTPVTDSFTEHVTKPLGDQMKKYIVDPLAKKMNSLFSLVGKVLGSVISAPMKFITGLGDLANSFNEKRVLSEEKKNRNEKFREDMKNGFSVGKFFSGIRSQFMSEEEKESILNEKLGYREKRNDRKNNRDEALEAEMKARAEKRANMQKQYEEDMTFGRNSGWKYASKKQKETREKELKDKQAWMQEKVATEVEETNKKISKITTILEKGSDISNETVNALKDIKKLLKDNLKSLGDKTGMGDVANKLRNMGQSHADGLDEVPEDGYIAELHEGEMVLPKGPAGLIRNMFGKKNNGLKSLFGKLMNNDKSDRADNALGLSDEEASQISELEDRQRYSRVSRKSVDFIQNMMNRKKKEKEEKAWKDNLLNAVNTVSEKVVAGNDIAKSIFGGLLDFAKGLPKTLSSLLSALGLSGLGALAATGLGAAAVSEYGNIAEEYGASTTSVINGYAREERLDADGMYVYDNQGSSTLGKFGHSSTRKAFAKPFKVGYDKIVKPSIEQGKTVYNGVKNTAQKGINVVKNGVSTLDNYINPKVRASGTSFLGTAYEYTGDVVDKSARKGLAKPIGAVSDITKTAAKRSKSAMTAFINGIKDALVIIQEKAVKKFPGIGSITKSVDNIISTLLKNSDEVYRKFGGKIALFIADTAADATIVGAAVELGTTVYDVFSGLTKGNTANLFGVPENQVDGEMRLITSFLQGLCKFSFMSIIWLTNEITSSMMGVDFLQSLARGIYSMLPINFGKKIDLSNDLKGLDVDKMSLEEAISAAGGDLSQFKDSNGNFKDITKLNNDNLSGISATEVMELQRLQYNQQNGTKLDSLAWKDKQSKTLGQKILGNDWVKNFKGSFQQQSIKGHMGLNTDAKLTLGDRAKYALGSAGVNMTNFLGKLTGNESMKNVTTEQLFQNYAEKRTTKYQNKVDKANATINKKLEANSKTDNKLVKAWNNMIIGIQKGKREKAREKIGTTKNKSQRQLQIEAMQNQDVGVLSNDYSDYDKNSANQYLKDLDMLEYEAYGMAAVNGSKGIAMGKGDDDTPISKSNINPSNKNSEATKVNNTVSKIFSNISKSVQKTGKELAKGLTSGNKTVSKSFVDANNTISKLVKSTKKTLDKDSETATKSLTKETKSLTDSISTTVKNITSKISDMATNIKNSIGEKVSNVTTTVKTSEPVKTITSAIEGVFNLFKKNNAGSSGAKSTDNVVKTPKHTITKSDFITPTASTTNNTTSNKFVFYNQGDSRWGGVRIGDSNLKDSGCGPTSLAMAISQMTGEQITPDTIAQLGKEHLPGYSTYSLFPSVADKLNMNYTEGNDSSFILNNLKRGVPVILSGKGNSAESPYTSEGHIVTASDIKGDKVFIQDPRGKEYSKYYPLQNLLNGLNKSMVLSPSNRTKNLPSSGKIQGWSNTIDSKISKYPLGIYGDIGSLETDNMNLGKSGGKVRVIDRVLSYMKAFLNQKSKFKYSQSQRDGINKNGSTADCSSFVGHVLSVAGDTPVSGTSQTMWDSVGTKVDTPQVGDIVCQQGHVGLYSGDGKYIHMSSPKNGIKESDAISKYNNPHRGYKRVLKDPNAMVDAVISGGNSLLGTITATESGTPVAGGSSSNNTTSNSSSEEVNQLGVFGKLGNIGQNMMASIFNGKQVDLFGNSSSDNVSSDGTTPSSTTWTGTKYDLSKYDMSNLSSTKKEHINKMIHATLQTYKTHGLFPSLTIAQSAQESGWGPTSGLAKNGNAMFGIKADKSWTGKVYRSKTKEVYNGNTVTITDGFRAYDDINEGIIDRANFLAKNQRYTNAGVFSAKTPEEQARALQKAGYATDPNYADSLIKLISSSNLKRFDSPKPPVEESAGKGPATATSAESAPSDGSIPTSMNGWAYYQQTDPQWNTETIDGTTVGKAGCGPSSHAMMLTSMFGQRITPDVMTKWAHKNGTWFSGGMYHTMPAKVASEFGLSLPKTWSGKSSTTLASIKAAIKSGNPVIMSGKGKSNNTNTPFTTGGHLVLAVGVDGNDNIIINDPRGPQYTKAYADSGLTDYGTGLRAAWAFGDTSSKKIPSGLSVGGSWTGGSNNSSNTSTNGNSESVDQLGVFGKLGNIGQNMMASIFNGKEVDLFSSSTDSGSEISGTETAGTTSINGKTVKALFTSYYPANNALQGGLYDAMGNKLDPSKKTCAAPKEVPFGTKIQVQGTGTSKDGEVYTVTDRGGAIKVRGDEYQFDLLSPDKTTAYAWGRKTGKAVIGDETTGANGDKGDGKTYWAKGFGDNKPNKVSYSGSMGKGDNTTQQYQNTKRLMEKSIRQIDRATIVSSGSINNSSTMNQACIEVLQTIVNELQSINNNTAATAKGISEIEIVSANEPISINGVSNSLGSKSNNSQLRQSNSNTGYDIARQIASYR